MKGSTSLLKLLNNFLRTRNSSKESVVQSCQSGGVLILVAITIFVLLLFIALAVETSLLQTGNRQVHQFVRVASLAAIEHYFRALEDECVLNQGVSSFVPVDRSDRHNCAMLAAKDRVIEISNSNTLISNREHMPGVYVFGEEQPSSSEKAMLQSGWWIPEASVCTDNPAIGCVGDEAPLPFFFPYSGAGTLDELTIQPNAMRIAGEFYPEGMAAVLGSTFFNIDDYQINAEAISSITPRHIFFSIDVSGTIAWETHIPWTNFGPFDSNNICPSGGENVLQAANIDSNCQQPPPNCCPELVDAHGNFFTYYTLKNNCNKAEFLIDGQGSPVTIGDNVDPALANGECYNSPVGPFELYYSHMDSGWDELSRGWNYAVGGNVTHNTANRPLVGVLSPDKHHFADDYRVRYQIGKSDYESFSATDPIGDFHPQTNQATDPGRSDLGLVDQGVDLQHQLVNIDYHRSDDYAGPEPYVTVLKGIRKGICRFIENRIPGDLVGIGFFDNEVVPKATRIVKLDARNIEYLVGDCDNPDAQPVGLLNTDFFDMDGSGQALPDETLPASQAQIVARLGAESIESIDSIGNKFIPKIPNEIGYGFDRLVRLGMVPGRLTFTDLNLGIDMGLNELIIAQRRTGLPASRHLVVFSDGMQNCALRDGQRVCRNFHVDYELGIEQLLDRISNVGSVAIHMFPWGKHIGPSTGQIYNPSPLDEKINPFGNGAMYGQYDLPDYCVTDNEFRKTWNPTQGAQGSTFTIGNSSATPEEAWNNVVTGEYLNGAKPFYDSNVALWKIAAVTGGVYSPIRKMDEDALAHCQNIINNTAGLDPELHLKGDPGEEYFNPETVHPLCFNEHFNFDTPYADGGRLLVDPYCANEDQQIAEALDTIMGGNPYSIVSVGGDAVG